MLNPSPKIQRPHLSATLKEKELWILVLLGILYFYRPLFLGETFFFRDIVLNILPQKQLLVDFIQAGELPLWNPYLNGGQPYLADIPFFTLYPTNLLYVFLPFIWAFNLNIVLHVIGSCVSAYLLARVIGILPISSLITGVVYGFCGYTLSLANHGCRLLAMPYLPLLFVFWHLYLHEGKRKWFITTVLAGVLQVFAGASEMNVISLLLLLGWTLIYPYSRVGLFRKIALWILLGLFIIGIASIQIFPTLEMVLESSRKTSSDYAAFSKWSLYPQRLPELIFPRFFGSIESLFFQRDYWGIAVMQEPGPYIISIYIGCIVLTLAVIGGLHTSKDRMFPFRVRISLLLLCGFSVLFSLGRFLPFFPLLYSSLPFIAIFRYPIKILIASLLPLALLTGYASDRHFGNYPQKTPKIPSGKLLAVLWSIALILTLFTATFMLSHDMATGFEKLVFKQSGGEVMRQGLTSSFTHAAGIWIVFTLLYHYRRLKRRSWQHWGIAGILILDLLFAGNKVNLYTPTPFFTDTPDVVPIIRQHIGDGRLFRPEVEISEALVHVPSDEIMWMFRDLLERLGRSVAVFYRIPLLFNPDFDGLASTRVLKLRSLMVSLPWEQRLLLLSAGGVTLIFTPENISAPGIRPIAELSTRINIPFYLYRNTTAAGRIRFVTDWKHVMTDDEALGTMSSLQYDPRKHVILQQAETTLFDRSLKTPTIIPPDQASSRCNGPSQIKKLVSNTHSTLLSVSNSCDGYLVFSDLLYPGWRIYVDGKRAPIWRANYAFSAVFLPAGDYEVKRVYRPMSLILGALSSGVFCLLLGVLAYTHRAWFLMKR